MEPRKSTTSPSRERTRCTEICMNCGTARSSVRTTSLTKSTPGNHKPRSTVKPLRWQSRRPDPARQAVLFFRFEWVRIALPIVDRDNVPTPAFQNYVLGQLPLAESTRYPDRPTNRPATGAVLQAALLALRQHAGIPLPVLGCPLSTVEPRRAGIRRMAMVAQTVQSVSHSSDDREQVQTARIDYNINDRNIAWFRFQATPDFSPPIPIRSTAVHAIFSAASVFVRSG